MKKQTMKINNNNNNNNNNTKYTRDRMFFWFPRWIGGISFEFIFGTFVGNGGALLSDITNLLLLLVLLELLVLVMKKYI